MLRIKYNQILSYGFLAIALLSVFNKPLNGVFNTQIFDYLDELLVLACAATLLIIIFLSKKIKTIYFLVLGFLIYSILISLLFGYNSNVFEVVLQSIINLKLFLVFLTLALLFDSRYHTLKKFFNGVLIVALFGLVLNIILGQSFHEIFGTPLYSRFKGDTRFGGFLQPNHMGFLMAMNIGMILSECKKEEESVTSLGWIKIILSIVVIFLADSRSAVIGAAFIFLAFYWEKILKNGKIFLGFIIASVVALILVLTLTNMYTTLVSNLTEGFDLEGHYIRGIMANMALQITYLHFPIGTGAATFGSVLSDGSPVYEYFGVANKYFFTEKSGIYDSSVASILGEYGFLGAMFFFLMFKQLKQYLNKASNNRNKIMLNGLFFSFFFYSLTNPTLTNNVYILIGIPVFMSFAEQASKQLKT